MMTTTTMISINVKPRAVRWRREIMSSPWGNGLWTERGRIIANETLKLPPAG